MMYKFNVGELKDFTGENRLPFVLHWNITEACNLNCTHCCVPKKPIYVDLHSALRTIDFLKEKGFFLITLSGGECLLHPNFREIYLALKKAGMYVNIFTNGTTLTTEIKDLLTKYKPRKVEVSVYGYDNESFSRTTGSNSGYSEFFDTLEFLKENQIRTVVKAPITVKNCGHLKEFIGLAENYNAEYKFGTFVFPMLDGNKKPLNERLPYQKAVDIEFADKNALEGFCNRVITKGNIAEHFTKKCSACNNSYTLNPDNSFSFCGMMVEPKFFFNEEVTIEDAFSKVTEFRDKVIQIYESGPCHKCELANACPGCPAHLQLETGSMDFCNEYFYKITKAKLKYAHIDISNVTLTDNYLAN